MKKIYTMLTLSLLISGITQACFVTVTNDTDQEIMLYDVNNPEEAGRAVSAGEKTVFGNKTTKADFVLAQKQRCGMWKKTLRVTQTMCGMTEEEENKKEDKFVSASGIVNRNLGEEMADFFEIEEFTEADNAAMPAKKNTACGCKQKL